MSVIDCLFYKKDKEFKAKLTSREKRKSKKEKGRKP